MDNYMLLTLQLIAKGLMRRVTAGGLGAWVPSWVRTWCLPFGENCGAMNQQLDQSCESRLAGPKRDYNEGFVVDPATVWWWPGREARLGEKCKLRACPTEKSQCPSVMHWGHQDPSCSTLGIDGCCLSEQIDVWRINQSEQQLQIYVGRAVIGTSAASHLALAQGCPLVRQWLVRRDS